MRSALLLLILVAACGGGSSEGGPPPVVGAVSVSAGGDGSCAIGISGGLACWGAVPDETPNDNAVFGADVLGAVSVPTSIDLIAVMLQRSSSGKNSGCAVGSDHATYCWGGLYEIGSISVVDLGSGIQPLAGATSASTVSIDGSVICVTRTDNAVKCFGDFTGGGRGSDTADVSEAGAIFSLTPNSLSPAQSAYGTALGYQMGCAIRTDSLITCWGARHRGQLGGAVGDTVADCSVEAPTWCQPGPALVSGGHKYRQVSSQYDGVCATRIDGGVDCWGRKPGAVIGDFVDTCPTASDCVTTPTAVTLPSAAVRVVVGLSHVCALLATGDVYCWGHNDYGQLGRPGGNSDTPVKVSGSFHFTAISAGRDHNCAIEAGTGAVGCWGANLFGQLGDGTLVNRDHPVAVVVAE